MPPEAEPGGAQDRGVFIRHIWGGYDRRSQALQEAINRYLEEHNRDPRPFVWTADPDAVVEKVRRAYHTLAAVAQRAG
jgi:hypothetical protein